MTLNLVESQLVRKKEGKSALWRVVIASPVAPGGVPGYVCDPLVPAG